MNMHLKSFLKGMCFIFLLLFYSQLSAQQPVVFNPAETFNPVYYAPGNDFRTASGKPGPKYWQNSADYKIQATFDTLSRKLQGKMTVVYTNNSPDNLEEIWLSLGQNRFHKDSRSTLLTPLGGTRFGTQDFTDGFVLHDIRLKDKTAKFHVMNGFLKILLPEGLKSKQKASFTISYEFVLPYNGADFMGIQTTLNGSIYQFSAWFPRIAVYDPVKGWNTDNVGYYVEPGKMDYKITVPAELIVQGTGKLINPEQVLTKAQARRLSMAAKSDTVIQIRTVKEVSESGYRKRTGMLTWHFAADESGDAIFALSKSFIWDAVKVNLPNKKALIAMSLYPLESNCTSWKQATQNMKLMLENYSRLWTPYPYPVALNIAGSVTGIAGPAVSFISYKSNMMADGVWSKLNHELGHTWFNIMVAANGRNGWMVEGLNSFINHVNGEILKGQTAFFMHDAIDWISKAKPGQSVATPMEQVNNNNFALLLYVKPAVALNLLRTQVLGKERFDTALKGFIQTWAFKHPTPEDFFRYVENACAEDLSWFWQSWFLNDWTLDQAITDVKYVDNNPEKGVNIELLNIGKMVMPVVVEILEFNGKVSRYTLPPQIWRQGQKWTFHYPSVSRVISVGIDPDQQLPDRDLSNNIWKVPHTLVIKRPDEKAVLIREKDIKIN